MTISIKNSPAFKKDYDRYMSFIKNCQEQKLKNEVESLLDQYLSLINEIDESLMLLVAERLINKTQQEEKRSKLAIIRNKIEEKIKK
jgi:spore cortex formation protein SpoVR/YcgB (stage V sporulation)